MTAESTNAVNVLESFSTLYESSRTTPSGPEITSAWKASPLRDLDGRERLRLMLEAQIKFRQYLQSVIDTGKLTKIETPSRLRRVAGGW